MTCPTQIHINTDALKHNLKRVRELAPNSKVLAMVKANAYGHGLVRTVKALRTADAFGVACLEEAMMIRGAALTNPIVLMSGFNIAEDLLKIIALNCDIVVHCYAQIEILEKCNLPTPLRVWLKIDTGMHRLGFVPAEVHKIYSRLCACKNVQPPPKLITHFANADSLEEHATLQQIENFNRAITNLHGEKSLANSAGILLFPQTHADWVRPGGLLYGVSPLPNDIGANHGLQPVMTLTSKIIAIHAYAKGAAIGYGSTWKCPENMLIGIVGIGYGDGYPRHAKNGTPVLVNGHLCALAGRVSMDMLAVDLRAYNNAKLGDEVILWGKGLAAEHVANWADTITYELFCGIARRGQN